MNVAQLASVPVEEMVTAAAWHSWSWL